MPRKITKAYFRAWTGNDPIQDDLLRSNCVEAGTVGHEHCGWCEKHNLPQFMCSCFVKEKNDLNTKTK